MRTAVPAGLKSCRSGEPNGNCLPSQVVSSPGELRSVEPKTYRGRPGWTGVSRMVGRPANSTSVLVAGRAPPSPGSRARCSSGVRVLRSETSLPGALPALGSEAMLASTLWLSLRECLLRANCATTCPTPAANGRGQRPASALKPHCGERPGWPPARGTPSKAVPDLH